MRYRLNLGQMLGVAAAAIVLGVGVAAQTVVTEPRNKYTPAQDAQLGREAAAEVEKQVRLLRDEEVNAYLARLGQRLVGVSPAELQHPEFRYSFKVVDAPEINAFALPGGPTYFHSGMIRVAKTEGEVAGVMAHEVSHVLLRHGTAQATKATPYQIGQMAGAILGSIVGGTRGRVIAQGSQLGIGAAFMRFSREYEKQADLLGTQIMASAGYDPRDMANMFRTIAQQSKTSGGPEWLSSHPDPGNRYDYVMREAATLRVENPVRQTAEFSRVRERLGTASAARSTPQPGGRVPSGNRGVDSLHNVELPSTDSRTYEGSAFQAQVPANWRELPGNNGVTFAPEGAYGQGSFSHGIEIGLASTSGQPLGEATRQLVASLRKSNPGLREQGSRNAKLDGRESIETTLSNEAQGGSESVRIVTTTESDGTLLYIVAVAPQPEAADYRPTFDRIVSSLRLTR